MDWEIVDKIDNKETIEEVEKTDLSIWDNPNATLMIRDSLSKKWYDIDKLLDMAIEIAEDAYASPRWEGWPDFWKRLKALELMMEAAWYVKRKNWVELKFSLSKLLYNK